MQDRRVEDQAPGAGTPNGDRPCPSRGAGGAGAAPGPLPGLPGLLDGPVAVIGAGSGGRSTAGQLALLGARVRLFNLPDLPETPALLGPVRESGGVELSGMLGARRVMVQVADSLEAALADARWVFVSVTAQAHASLARLMGPFAEGRVFVLLPGRTLGAYAFWRGLQGTPAGQAAVAANPPSCIVAETHSLPYVARLGSGPSVTVAAIKKWLALGAIPAGSAVGVCAVLRALWPGLHPVASTLQTGLMNLGAMIHPATMVLNAARVEATGGGYPFYGEAITPSVAAVIGALDLERRAVAAALGAEVPSLVELTAWSYDLPEGDLLSMLRANRAYEVGLMPAQLAHRYLDEDVPTGLVPIADLARRAGVPAPVTESILQLASIIRGRDYRREGRTLASLGLEGVAVPSLLEALKGGDPAPRVR